MARTSEELANVGNEEIAYRDANGQIVGLGIGTNLSVSGGELNAAGWEGSGDVVGPATNDADYLPQWNGPNSKTLKNGLPVPAGGLAGLTEVGTKMNKFSVTALKTTNYTANVDEYVPCDISSGSFTITLPTAPADKAQIEILIVKTAADRVLTIQSGGTDKFNRTDGPQTIYMYLAIESLVCTYQSSTGIWFLQSAAAPFNFATGFPGIDAMTPITEADISIDTSTRVLTINPSRGYFDFFVDGGGKISRLRKNGAVNFPAFTDTSGMWFFYFNSSGTAITTQTPWTTNDFSDISTVYRILWNKDLFSFTVTAATATAGDTYTNNSSTFTVQESISGGTTLICKRTTGTNNPSASGNLTRATGAGTDPIVFSAFSESPKLVDQIVEYHQNTISAEDHEWKHLYGTVWESGFTIANNAITSGAPNADGRNSVIALSTGENIDDNLRYTVTNSTGGAAWQQDLGDTTPASLNATNSALFKTFTQDSNSRVYFLPATRFPFAWNPTTNIPQYITATGVRTSVTSTNFFVYFVYATQNPITGEAIRTVSATSQFTSITNARAYVWVDIQNAYSILANDPEIRPLYRLIFEHRTSYDDGAKNAALRETQDIRRGAVTSTTVTTGSLPATSVTTTAYSDISATNMEEAKQQLADQRAKLVSPTFTTPAVAGSSTGKTSIASANASATDYVLTLPAATGTFALVADLAAYVPTTRTLTINGTALDLSADRSWTVSGLAWASSISGTSGTGLTLTVSNSASASTVAQSIVIGNTQTNAVTGFSINTGTSNSAPRWLNITIWNTGNSAYANGLNMTIEDAGSWYNRAVNITNNETNESGWFHISQIWNGWRALQILISDNVSNSSGWFVKYLIWNTQSAASIIQKIDLGTSAQGHTGLLINAYNASTSCVALKVDGSTTWTGKVLSAVYNSTERTGIFPAVADGASAIAYLLDTTTSLSNAGAKLLSISNAGTEKAYFSATGELCNDATNKWKFGGRTAATVALDTTQYLTVTIGGTAYKVWIVA